MRAYEQITTHKLRCELNTHHLLCSNYPFSQEKCPVVYSLLLRDTHVIFALGANTYTTADMLQIHILICPAVVCIYVHLLRHS